MNQTLIIRFTDATNPAIEWLSVDSASQASRSGAGGVDTLAELEPAERIILLFPTSRTLFSQAEIPSKNPQHIQQAARALIEENLIDNIDDMHIVTRRGLSNQVDIAAVDRNYLQGLIDQLEQHQLSPQLALPDCLAIPITENGWTIIEGDNGLLIRTDVFAGIHVDHDWLNQSESALQTLAPQAPDQLSVYRLSADEDTKTKINYEQWFADVGISLANVDNPQQLLSFCTNPSTLLADTNFLVGTFTPKQTSRYTWLNWRLPVYSTAAGLLIFTLVLLLQGQRYNSQLEDVNQQIDTLFRQTFPQITTIVDYRLQFERELKRQGGNAAAGPVLVNLYDVLSHIKDANQLALVRLSYTQKNIILDIQSPDIGSAEHLIAAINQNPPYSARLLSAQNRDNGTRIRIQVTPGDAS